MLYKVKLSYPTIIEINGTAYSLFPDKEIDLPDTEIVRTYEGLGYIEKIEKISKKQKEVKDNAS